MTQITYVKSLKSAKKSEITASPRDLITYIKSKQVGYEIINQNTPCIPYYDYDYMYETEEEMLSNLQSDIDRIKTELATCYDLPNANMIVFSSNGLDTDKKQFKNSIHVILRKVGFFKTNQDIIQPQNGTHDPNVYNTYQKFRLPFCSKAKQHRYKDLYFNDITYDINKFHETKIKFADLLITNVEGETEVESTEIELASDRDSDSDSNSENECDDEAMMIDLDEIKNIKPKTELQNSFSTIEDFKNLLNLLNTKKRIENYKSWLNVIRICKNIYKTFTEPDQARKIIHDFMSKDSREGAYKENEVNTFLDKKDTNIDTATWGSLCYMASEDDEDGYNKLTSKPKTKKKKKKVANDDTWNLDRITELQKEPRRYYWGDYLQFNGKNLKNPNEIIKYFVDTAFMIANGGGVFYITSNRGIKEINGSEIVFEYSQKTLSHNPFMGIKNSCNFKINGETYELCKFSKQFFEHFHYTSSEMLPFAGDKDPFIHSSQLGSERFFNRFEAFEMALYKPKKTGVFSKILYHIEEVVCCGDKKLSAYLLAWLAFKLQKPYLKQEVGILLQGLEGTGKNMFVEVVKLLFGQRYIFETGDIEDITKNFNSQLSGKLLVVGDELIGYAGFKKSDLIKNLMTAPTINITKKGLDSVSEKSFHSFIFTTNNIETLRLSKNDRRILVVAISSAMMGNFAYFKELKKEMNDLDNIKAFFDFLMGYDISEFDFRKAPITKLKQEMIIAQLDEVYDWFLSYVEGKTIEGDVYNTKCLDVYEDYCEYTNSKPRKKDLKAKIKHLLQCVTKKKMNGQNYIFNVKDTNKMLMDLMKLDYAPLGGEQLIYDSDDD